MPSAQSFFFISQVVAVGIWLLSYVVDWLHELELGAGYALLLCYAFLI